jgi:hypothetical protein
VFQVALSGEDFKVINDLKSSPEKAQARLCKKRDSLVLAEIINPNTNYPPRAERIKC